MANKRLERVKAEAQVYQTLPPPEQLIAQPKTQRIYLEIAGTADLLQNRFSQKAVEQMLRTHMGISVQKEKKNPRQVLEDATIKNLDGRISVSPSAFKQAMISAASQIKAMKKTELRTGLFVCGQSIPITYAEMVPQMDYVRTAGIGRTPDVRFRPAFKEWKARMAIEYGELYSVQSVIDLLQRAGHVGVGEWRPEKDGTNGTFKVIRFIDDPDEWAEIEIQCASPLERLTVPTWALDQNIEPELVHEMVKKQIKKNHAA